MQNHLERQIKILDKAKVPASVGTAMDCWVDWLRGGEIAKGYPKSSVGFSSSGINCFDDMDAEAASYAARSVDGTVSSLEPLLRTCINIVWLGQSIYLRRISVEEKAIEAIVLIHRGLQARGCA